jgi:hypothetical protein
VDGHLCGAGVTEPVEQWRTCGPFARSDAEPSVVPALASNCE